MNDKMDNTLKPRSKDEPTKVRLVANPAYRNAVDMPRPVCDIVTEDGKVVAQFMFDRQMLDYTIILKEVDGDELSVDLNLTELLLGGDPAQHVSSATCTAMNILASRLNLWIDWEPVFELFLQKMPNDKD